MVDNLMIDDLICDYYKGNTLLVPINLKSAKFALANGYTIKIEMDNGEVLEVLPGTNLDQFIKDNNIELKLKE